MFVCNDTATTEIYTLSLHDALPISAQPLRAELNGQTVSPGIFEVMEILGRDETLARLDDVLKTP